MKTINKAMMKDFGKKFGNGALLFVGGVIACIAEEVICRNAAAGVIGLFSGSKAKAEEVNVEEPEEEDESEDDEEE